MANTDKDILITPNNGSSSADPKIEFKGADASTSAQTITATAYPTNNGTLSFDGSAGQLFSITNDMTGTIFSVNDVSGIPSIEVDDDGTIRFAEYSGNVLIGTATDDGSKLQVNGTVAANNITLGDTIYHNGDTNTFVSFGTDIVNITTGGTARIYADNTGVRLGDTGNGYFQPISGTYGSIQIDGGAHGGWEGYSIGGRAVFMHDNSSGIGIYNDVDNEWLFYGVRNDYTAMYHNGTYRIATSSTGVTVNGTAVTNGLTVNGDSSLNGKVYAQARSEKVRTLTTTSGNIQVYLTEVNGTDPDSIIWCTADATADRNISLTYDTTKRGTDIAHTVTVLFTNGATPYKMGSFWQGGAYNPSTGSTVIIFPTAIKWQGGSAPAAGNANSIDAYTFTYLYNGSAVQVIGSGPNQFA